MEIKLILTTQDGTSFYFSKYDDSARMSVDIMKPLPKKVDDDKNQEKVKKDKEGNDKEKKEKPPKIKTILSQSDIVNIVKAFKTITNSESLEADLEKLF